MNKPRTSNPRIWERIGSALALAATAYLLFISFIQLIYPAQVVAVQSADAFTSAIVLLVILTSFVAGLIAYRYLRVTRIAETILSALAVFAVSGLISLLRFPDTDRGSKLGFAVLLLYALVHLAVFYWQRKHKQVSVGKLHARNFSILSSRTVTVILLVLLFAGVATHLLMNGIVLYAQAHTLTSHTFDHGIFVQAMEGILRTGQPVTTLERGRELSHFAVHFSPVLYLVAPFYAIFRSQEFLNLFQLVPVFLALLPLYKVLRVRGFGLNMTLLVMLLYVVGPAQIFSSHYGFHENVFLGLGIFTLWYFWETRNPLGIILGAALVLSVKEDAFIYVFAFALWQLFDAYIKRERGRIWRSLVLGAVALVYFIIVTTLMAKLGEGTMQAHRFANLLPDNAEGFTAILNVMLTQPGYVVTQIFLEQKWSYILLVLAAVAFAPLWSRAFHANWLLVPLIFVNLLSNWKYQFDIGFQYHYGTSAFLLMILVVAVSQPASIVPVGAEASTTVRGRPEPAIQRHPGQLATVVLIVAAIVFSTTYSFKNLAEQVKSANQVQQAQAHNADAMRTVIASLPKDKTYLISNHLGPAMAAFPNVYLEGYELPTGIEPNELDYIVLDARYSRKEEHDAVIRELKDQYQLEEVPVDAPLQIYKKPAAKQPSQ